MADSVESVWPEPDPLRVLLFSPLDGLDPPSGDTTYTQTLLDRPPPGVTYTSYAAAVEDGLVLVRGRRRPRHWLGAADLPIALLRGVEHALAGSVCFREPTWWISVRPGAFDLVHTHLFTLRQVAQRTPTMSSAGFPLSVLYRHREQWPEWRVRLADRAQLAKAAATRAHAPGYYAPTPDVLTVYTEHYRDWLVQRGASESAVTLSGQGLPDLEPVAAPQEPPTFGFVGRDFVRKGGPLALAAFEVIRRVLPEARLRVVTDVEADVGALGEGVSVVRGATREQVVRHHLPDMVALVAPTTADCGAPFGVIEALRAGTPVVICGNPWLDPRLRGPGIEVASATASAVAAAALRLVSAQDGGRDSREAARRLFCATYSLEALHDTLLAGYQKTLQSAQASCAP